MAKKAQATGEVLGVEFYVDENWKFVVPELGSSHKSYDLMCDAIEKSQKEIQKSRTIKLDLACVSSTAQPFRVVGIHAGHGKPLTTPQGKWEYSNYPDVKWITDAIKKKRELSREASRIGNAIDAFAIGRSRGYRSSTYTHEELQEAYNQQFKAAESTTFEAAMKKYGGKGEIDL